MDQRIPGNAHSRFSRETRQTRMNRADGSITPLYLGMSPEGIRRDWEGPDAWKQTGARMEKPREEPVSFCHGMSWKRDSWNGLGRALPSPSEPYEGLQCPLGFRLGMTVFLGLAPHLGFFLSGSPRLFPWG